MTPAADAEEVRVDRWLWSVRLFKTRSLATEAVRAGHVSVNDRVTKAATSVRVGDRVVVRTAGRTRQFEVLRLVSTRVGAPVAAECLLDHTPVGEPQAPPAFVREPAAGRPTKRDRRRLDRLRRS